ncbi:hypothetical protein GCM10027613_01850 [Microlunatus endophyticus]
MAAAQAVGLDPFRITALCARRVADALAFRSPADGVPPRPPASANENDPLGAPHRYVSDLQTAVPAVFDDWHAMLDADLVDAVLILAPVSLHHQIAVAALDAGKHVLIEKPLAITVRAGRAIAAAAGRRGLVAGVAENVRYASRTRAQWQAIDAGLIGRPQLWLSGGIGGEWAPDRVVADTPWRHRKLDAGGGPAIDHGVHLMHQLRYLMGPVRQVGALTAMLEPYRVGRSGRVANEVEDIYSAQLLFESGAIGTVFSGWAGRGAGTSLDASPSIYGSSGCIKADRLIPDGGAPVQVESVLGESGPGDSAAFFPHGIRDSFALELLDFATAISTGNPMETSADEAVLDLAMAYSILESAWAGAPVQVDDVLSGAVAGYQAEIDRSYGLQVPNPRVLDP